MNRNSWNDRPVLFEEFSIRSGKAVVAAFQRDNEEGTFALLVASLRYADDSTPVFASIDDVFETPFRHRERLSYLAGKCAFVNGLRDADPDTDVPPDAHNGHAEAAGPSH